MFRRPTRRVLVIALLAAGFAAAALLLPPRPRTAEGLVTGYLEQHGTRLGSGSSMRTLTVEDLPPDTVFVLAQLSDGVHDTAACLVRAEQVYCSTGPQDFAAFMRDYGYFEHGGLNDQQIWRAYRTLAQSSGLEYVKYTDIRLVHSDAGLVLTYGVTQEPDGDPLRLTMTLSRDYRLEHGPAPGA